MNKMDIQMREVIEMQKHHQLMSERNAILLEKSLKMQDYIGKGCNNNSILIDKNMKLQNQISANNDHRSDNFLKEFEQMNTFMNKMQA